MNLLRYILVLGALATCVSACKNAEDDAVGPVPDNAFVKVINPTTATINFYMNGTRQNNTSYIYSFGATGYQQVIEGEQNYQFKQVLEPGNVIEWFSTPLKLDAGLNYSLFVTGNKADQLIVAKDTLKGETGNFAKVRFVHTSPGIAAMDVKVGDTVAFNNRSFKSVTGFTKVGSGRKKLNVYLSGSATPQLSGTVILLPGRVYTIYSRGTLNGTGTNAFSTGLVTDL